MSMGRYGWGLGLTVVTIVVATACSFQVAPVETEPAPRVTATATAVPVTATVRPTTTPVVTYRPPPYTVAALRAPEITDVIVEGDGWDLQKGAVEIVDVPESPLQEDGAPAFERALQVQTLNEPARLVDLRVVVPTAEGIRRDDVLWLSFYARAVTQHPLEPSGYVKVYVQPIYPILHWMRPIDKVVPLRSEWQRVTLPFVAKEHHLPGEAGIYLAFGFPAQTVEIGGIELVDYGTETTLEDLAETPVYDGYAWGTVDYAGRDPDAVWRQAAEARIEAYRKGDLTIYVKDAGGTPLADAEVFVRMTRHSYNFGSAVAAKWLTDASADGDRYRAVVADHYNKIVFENDLKYGPWEEAKTAARSAYFVRTNTFEAMAWLAAHDIAIRGHTLIWGPIRSAGYNRDFDFVNDADAAREALLTHLEERLVDTQMYVQEWDVINHPVATFGDQGNRLDLVYGPEFYVEAMQRARAAHPNLVAYVNEGNILTGAGKDASAYEAFIQDMIDAGAGPDGIGFMGHFDEGALVSPEILLQRLDRFAAFGLPLQVTEFDITTQDGKVQADYTRDFMTLVFSHPATEGIIMWGFWEGQHWQPSAALFQQDWALKPNGQMWLNLVEDLWCTRETGVTDAGGIYRTRGFLGDYEIQIKMGEETRTFPIHLDSEGTRVVVTWGK